MELKRPLPAPKKRTPNSIPTVTSNPPPIDPTFPARKALDALRLSNHNHDGERAAVISATAGLLLKLQNIDESLCRARAELVVLQPNRDRRVDLRVVKHRSISGARDYCFVQWNGVGIRQYARKLSLKSASMHVRQESGKSRRSYSMARKLTQRIVKMIEVRRQIIAAFLSLRRTRKALENSKVLAALVEAINAAEPMSLTMMATYAAGPIAVD
jgi:hypothetical protein